MLQLLFASMLSDGVTPASFFACCAAALGTGALIAVVYRASQRASAGFLCALMLIPLLSQTVVMTVSGSLGAGLAVAGAFGLIRFRSVPGTAHEICAIFLSLVSGIACGMGYIGIAVTVTVLALAAGAAVFALARGGVERSLQITAPESLRTGELEEVLGSYAERYTLVSIRTVSMGALLRFNYRIRMKRDADEREMLDELRCRNGNLDIICSEAEITRDEM